MCICGPSIPLQSVGQVHSIIPLISIPFLSPSHRPSFSQAGIVSQCPLQLRETCFDGVDFPPALEISGCFHFPEEGLTLCLLSCGGLLSCEAMSMRCIVGEKGRAESQRARSLTAKSHCFAPHVWLPVLHTDEKTPVIRLC